MDLKQALVGIFVTVDVAVVSEDVDSAAAVVAAAAAEGTKDQIVEL